MGTSCKKDSSQRDDVSACQRGLTCQSALHGVIMGEQVRACGTRGRRRDGPEMSLESVQRSQAAVILNANRTHKKKQADKHSMGPASLHTVMVFVPHHFLHRSRIAREARLHQQSQHQAVDAVRVQRHGDQGALLQAVKSTGTRRRPSRLRLLAFSLPAADSTLSRCRPIINERLVPTVSAVRMEAFLKR